MEEILNEIQNRVLELLGSFNTKLSLDLLSADNCSEMSRLAGCWIIEKAPLSRVYVMKGVDIKIGEGKAHDILFIYESGKIYIVDVTIWQFVKDKKNIFIKEENNLFDALKFIEKKYGGKWNISENITIENCKEMENWKTIIKKNISSLNQLK